MARTVRETANSADMTDWHTQVEAVRAAIQQLQLACTDDADPQRMNTAQSLEELFWDVNSPAELQQNVRRALALYGGANSFQDIGTAEMARAVDALRTALLQALPTNVANSRAASSPLRVHGLGGFNGD